MLRVKRRSPPNCVSSCLTLSRGLQLIRAKVLETSKKLLLQSMLPLGLQVYQCQLLGGLKYMNRIYFGLPDASFDTFISARLVVGRFFLEAHICHMIRASRAKTSCSSNFQVHRARIGILAPSWPIISEARGTFYPRAYKFQNKVTGPYIFHNNPISS